MSSNNGNVFDSGLEMARRAVLGYRNTAGDGSSIADLGKIGRFQPITLISSNLRTESNLTNILYGILDVTAAFYVTGINVLATKMVDSRILKILDSVNPDRDLRTVTTALSMESSHVTLDIKVNPQLVINARKYLTLEGLEFGIKGEKLYGTTLSGESAYSETYKALTGLTLSTESSSSEDTSEGAVTVHIDSLEERDGTVGKVIEVDFQTGSDSKQKITMPIVVKLDNMYVPSEVLTNMVTMNEDRITIGARLSDAFAGRISFVKDFLLCQDLIKKQRESLMKDPSRAYAELLNRINRSKVYSVLSRNVSLGTISGVLVISEVENDAIRREIGGDLTNKTTRKMVFNNLSVMMIAVVDRERETVSIFVRDMDTYSTAMFNAFKKSGKNEGSDQLTEIFKSMSMGRVPTF